MTTPRVYVICVASYNEGKVHGAWFDADVSGDELQNNIDAMLEDSSVEDAEEWAIHDYEGFCGLRVDEYPDITELCDMAYELEELKEEYGQDAVECAIEIDVYSNISIISNYLKHNYRGRYDSVAEYLEDLHDECGHLDNVPDHLRYHIDWEGVARDTQLNGELHEVRKGGYSYIFSEL